MPLGLPDARPFAGQGLAAGIDIHGNGSTARHNALGTTVPYRQDDDGNLIR